MPPDQPVQPGDKPSPPPAAPHRWISRETRLLLITIGVSVAALLLLSRFRFPEQAQIANPVPPPLERLAARATYDELATIMAQLQTQVQPGVVTLRVAEGREGEETTPTLRYLPAVRIDDRLAVMALAPEARVQSVAGVENAVPVVLARDRLRRLALVRVPAVPDAPAWLRERPAAPRVPGYLAVAEGGRGGLALRPLFVSRLDPVSDPRWEGPLLQLGGQADVPDGSFLFTLEGALVGLVWGNAHARFVIPTAQLQASVERLNRGGTAAPGDLGLSVQALTPPLAAATGATDGVVVAAVVPQGPAAHVVQVGDVIETMEGAATYAPEAFDRQVSTIPAGTTVTIGLMRRGTRMTVEVTAGRAPIAPAAAPAAPTALGLTLRAAPGGAQVLHVLPKSAAALAGVEAGDIITSLDGRTAPTPDQIRRAYRQTRRGTFVLAGLERAGQPRVVAIATPKP